MSDNLITTYLSYKKKRLTIYGLSLYSNLQYKKYIQECLEKYFNNYIEVIYHNKFETLGENAPITKENIEIEQDGMRLELLSDLSVREIIETNEGYKQKQIIINQAKEIAMTIIEFDQTNITEDNVKNAINTLVKKINEQIPLRQNAENNWYKAWQETKKQIKTLFNKKENFVIKEIKYQEDLSEVDLLPKLKQLNNYKKNLVERVYHAEKITYNKIKLLVIILNQLILKKIITKEKLGEYILYIPEEIWSKKQEIDSIYKLLNDSILKQHVILGIHYNQLINSKTIQEKHKEGYQFACYQDFTHITEIGEKIDSIDASLWFKYLIITGYKSKDLQELEKQEPVNIKAVLFSKEG